MKKSGLRFEQMISGLGPERFLKNSKQRDNYFFLLKLRERIRKWLNNRGYLEVLVPCLSPETVPDLNLESFSVNFRSVFDKNFKQRLFLQTSPELLMKRMLVGGFERIFYLGPAFRQGEFSKIHHPEFTMVEWYCKGADYFYLMDELEEFLREFFGKEKRILRMTMRDALKESAGFDFLEMRDLRGFRNFIKERIPGVCAKGFIELFELAVVHWLEPFLKDKGIVFIYDWPSQLAMQGRIKKDEPGVCERFELYINGIEVGNGYSEETDVEEMRKRFKVEEKSRRMLKRERVGVPERFLKSLELGLTECAGVSIGLERLCMSLLGIEDLDELMAFREI